MVVGRVVPWASWDEWDAARAWLFSRHDRAAVRAGVDRVAAWRARGRVPAAVDATAALLEVALLDPHGAEAGLVPAPASSLSHTRSPVSDYALRLQYSAALVRLVNGVADALQKGRVALAVSALAGCAGLSRLLVDLRHEAAHNGLPALPALRLGCRHALEWLEGRYWSAQAAQRGAGAERAAALLARLRASAQAGARKDAATSSAGAGSNDGDDDDEDEDEETAVRSSRPAQRRKKDGAAGAAAAAGDPRQQQQQPYRREAGKRERRQVLTELRTLVPVAHAEVLVAPCLDTEALFGRAEARAAAGDKAAAAAAAGSAAAAGAGGTPLLRGCDVALGSLFRQYPRLRGLLLKGAAERLVSAAEATTVAAAAASVANTQLGLGAVDPDVVTAEIQRHQDMAADACAHWAGWVERACGSAAGAGAGAAAAGEAAAELQGAVAAVRAKRKRREEDQGAAASPAAGRIDAALARATAALAAEHSRAASAGAAADAPETPQASGPWQRAQCWRACAIGCLPSPHDPCGRLPPLDLAPPAPAALVRASSPAAAAAGAAPSPTPAATPWEQQQQQQQVAAAVGAPPDDPLADLLAAPWPEAEEEGEEEEERDVGGGGRESAPTGGEGADSEQQQQQGDDARGREGAAAEGAPGADGVRLGVWNLSDEDAARLKGAVQLLM